MHIVTIEVAKQKNLAEVLRSVFRSDPDKIVFIGDAPEHVQMARETGRTVEVLAAGSEAPPNSTVIAPSTP